MEILINGANLLYVAAYFTTDLLRLRILTMIAALCLSAYFSLQPEPLLNVVAWNLFFFALNGVQLARIVRSRIKASDVPAEPRTTPGPHPASPPAVSPA
jgi:hypothetical protein